MNNNDPLISVIIPVYNVEPYVLDALSSVSVQTYNNLEVIVVDDCSSDRTAQIVEEFCANDERFKLIRNERNLRIAKTLNKALSFAKGEYIARFDGDDLMEYDRLERQIKFLKSNPRISLVGCSYIAIDERGEYLRHHYYPAGIELNKNLLKYCSPIAHIWLARKEVYDNVGGYRIPTVEDYDFILRAAHLGYVFDNIPNYYGMKMRMRTDNTVGRFGLVQRKLFNYARMVNAQSVAIGKDLYCENDVLKIMQNYSKGFLAKIHYYSDILSRAASRNRNYLQRIGLLISASLVSPYKFQYYFNAFRRLSCIKASKYL